MIRDEDAWCRSFQNQVKKHDSIVPLLFAAVTPTVKRLNNFATLMCKFSVFLKISDLVLLIFCLFGCIKLVGAYHYNLY